MNISNKKLAALGVSSSIVVALIVGILLLNKNRINVDPKIDVATEQRLLPKEKSIKMQNIFRKLNKPTKVSQTGLQYESILKRVKNNLKKVKDKSLSKKQKEFYFEQLLANRYEIEIIRENVKTDKKFKKKLAKLTKNLDNIYKLSDSESGSKIASVANTISKSVGETREPSQNYSSPQKVDLNFGPMPPSTENAGWIPYKSIDDFFIEKAHATQILTCSEKHFIDPREPEIPSSEFLNLSEPEITLSAEMLQVAGDLKSPLKIFNYVRDKVDYEANYKAKKSAQSVFNSKSGNPWDQSTLLVSMLRSQGVASRYVVGDVLIEKQHLKNLWGVQTDQSVHYMHYFLYPKLAEERGGNIWQTLNGKIYYRVPHVWIEAFIPFDESKGVGVQTASKTWVPLDPSFRPAESVYRFSARSWIDVEVNRTNQELFTTEDYLLSRNPETNSHTKQALPSEIITANVVQVLNSGVASGVSYALPYTEYKKSVSFLKKGEDVLNIGPVGAEACVDGKYSKLPDNEMMKLRVSGPGLSVTVNVPENDKEILYSIYKGYSATDQTKLDQIAAGTLDPNSANVSGRSVLYYGDNIIAQGSSATFGTLGNFGAAIEMYSRKGNLISDVKDPRGGSTGFNSETYTYLNEFSTYFNEGYEDKVDHYLNELEGIDIDSLNFSDRGKYIAKSLRLALLTLYRNDLLMKKEIDESTRSVVVFPNQPSMYMKAGYQPVKVFDRNFGFVPNTPVVSWVGSSRAFARDRDTDFIDESKNDASMRAALDALAIGGSTLEHKIFEEFYAIEGQSTVKVIQTAKDQGVQVLSFDVTPSNKSSVLGQLTNYNANFKSGLSNIMSIFGDAGKLIIPVSSVTIGPNAFEVYHFDVKGIVGGANILGRSYGGSGGAPLADSPTGIDQDKTNNQIDDVAVDVGDSNANTYVDGVKSGDAHSIDIQTGDLIDRVSCVGAPVNLNNGGMWHEFVDIPAIGGARPNLSLSRIYQSQSTYDGPLGYGWTHNFNLRIVASDGSALNFASDQIIDFYDESNSKNKVTFDNGVPVLQPSSRLDFEKTGGKYKFTRFNKDVLLFHGSGPLIGKIESLTTRNGNQMNFTYDSGNYKLDRVTDSIGRHLAFSYNPLGRLERVTDFTGRFVEFEYDARGDLSLSKDMDGNATTYTYLHSQENPALNHNLSSFRDPEGNGVDYFYFLNDKVFKHIEPEGKISQFVYNTFNNETYVYDGRNDLRKYQYDLFGNIKKKINPDNTFQAYKWDIYRNKIESQDEEGFKTKFKTDERGNVTEIEPPAPFGKTVYTIHSTYNTPSKAVDGNGNNSDYSIDAANGNILSETRYTEVSGGLPVITQFEYEADGRIRKVTDPKNSETIITRTRDAQFNETIVTQNALGDTMTQVFDPLGRLTQEVDYGGRITNITYDIFNNILTREVVGSGLIEEFSYDKMGRLSQSLKKSGGQVQATSFALDGLGNILSQTNELGETSRFEYKTDSCACGIEGQVRTIIDAKGNRTSLDYDFRGNVTSLIDAKNAKTLIDYDSRGFRSRVRTKNPSGSTFFDIKFETGSLGELSKTMERFTTTSSTLRKDIYKQGVGETYAETITNYIYDPSGNLSNKKWIRGWTQEEDEISYTYNGLNSIKSKKIKYNGADEESLYEYDLNQNLTKLSNIHSILGMTYDKLNRIEEVTTSTNLGQGIRQPDSKLKYTYDKVGNVLFLRDRNDQNVYAKTYDALNRLDTLNSQDYGFSFGYDGFQRFSQINYPNGLVTSISRDDKNQITAINTPGLANIGYRFDLSGNIIEINGDRGQWNYGYNSRDELINSKYKGSRELASEQFIWNASGNNIAGRSAKNTTRLAGQRPYIRNNVLLEDGEITNDPTYGSGRFAYRYDFKGNVIEKYDNIKDEHFFYRYSSENRLRESTKADASNNFISRLSYRYDGLGRRVEKELTKTDGSVVRKSYVYDGDNILFEYDKDNAKVATYIGSGRVDDPLMMLRENKPYFFHKDHLGSIISVSDEAGGLVQQNFYSSFGKVERMEDKSGNVVTFDQAVDSPYYFTGREYDQEHEMYYYRARYYDQSSGRFMSIDPLGIGTGDNNLYSYARNNPLNQTDPTGMIVVDPGGIIPDWVKETDLYQSADNSFSVIIVRDKQLEDVFGSTYTYANVVQTVDIDVGSSNLNGESLLDVSDNLLTGAEDTLIHELTHAVNNLSQPISRSHEFDEPTIDANLRISNDLKSGIVSGRNNCQ